MSKITIFQGKIVFCGLLLLIFSEVGKSQGFNFNGQISSWGSKVRVHNEWNGYFGMRYIPHLNYSILLNENDVLNSELLFNTYYETNFKSGNHNFKTYRAILRYSSTQSEIQIGLQKIEFGPARLLRSLMWFDRVDPRDPLNLTDGVYALRYKYSFLDNSMLWFWCLFGNTDNTGYEILATAKNAPEFGGRLQMPLLSGEIAATFHTRKVDAMVYDYSENRYALDGHWDAGIGLWFEAVFQQSISDLVAYKWNRMTTLGTDYTIPEGSGIYVMAEHMNITFSESFWETDQSWNISAMMITYSPDLLDNLTLQEYYDWRNKNIYHYFQVKRTYDNFFINLSLFHYPEDGRSIFFNGNSSLLSGYGLQLMLIYNY